MPASFASSRTSRRITAPLQFLSSARLICTLTLLDAIFRSCALEYVHALEIVHRDVKPENVGIASDDTARLIDFGTAAWLSDTTEMSKRCGTLGYMAPELFFHDTHGLPVDAFALGATFFFVLSKQYALAPPGMTYEYVAKKMKHYSVTFGSEFSHVSADSKELILWLLHPCDSWRPDARRVLARPPFTTAYSTSEDMHVMPSFESQLQAAGCGGMLMEPSSHSRAEQAGNAAHQDTADSASWQSTVRFMTTLDQCLFGLTHSV
eukprot:TRINITY_DN6717_c0_g1_i4.p1 TRINITY_DN6717_c0_g1~~TRINITY_DN6717_c0_g1_i4.p1  ORF type:complete len:264 (+),score=28.98 TRINITY_DN6717_c0_g1_i4:408-1199(+)